MKSSVANPGDSRASQRTRGGIVLASPEEADADASAFLFSAFPSSSLIPADAGIQSKARECGRGREPGVCQGADTRPVPLLLSALRDWVPAFAGTSEEDGWKVGKMGGGRSSPAPFLACVAEDGLSEGRV